MSIRLAFASHVATIGDKQYDGIGNSLKETMPDVIGEYVYVRHSMDGLIRSEIQMYKNNKVENIIDLKVVRRPGPLRYISEVVVTVGYFSKYPVDVFIGIDPLNALAGVILKKRKKIKKVIFYTPDYSPKRFGNALINWVYHRIDKYCVKHADEVWSVSQKIVAIRKDMGLDDEKNKFLPNVPPLKYQKYNNNKHNKHQLITTGIIDTQMDFEGAIRAIALLRDRYPDVSLTVVGNGPAEEGLKKLAQDIGVADVVHFVGRKTLPETLELVSKSGVGLALYTGTWEFNEYGDSTKCREYGSYGLPIISTKHHATVQEIINSGAGIIVEQEVNDYARAIKAIFKDYDNVSDKSRLWGEKHAGMHAKLIGDALKSVKSSAGLTRH